MRLGVDDDPIPMVLHCPRCGLQHIDAPEPEKGWTNPPHKSHLCHGCGCIWRPAMVPTCGVAHLANEGQSDTWAPGDPTLRDLSSRLYRACSGIFATVPEAGDAHAPLGEALGLRERAS